MRSWICSLLVTGYAALASSAWAQNRPVPVTSETTKASTDRLIALSKLQTTSIQRQMRLALEEIGIAADPKKVITDHHVESYLFAKDDVVLFVSAEGAPYFPFPDIIDERDRVWLAIIDEQGKIEALTSIEVGNCDRVPLAPRVLGSLKVGASTVSAGELAHRVVSIGPCAGSDDPSKQPKITIKSKDGAAAITSGELSYPVNQVFTLSIGVALGYDNTTRRSLRARVRPGDTVPTIAAEDDKEGLTSLAAISWYPLGRDFRKKDLKYIGERFSLFVGVDLARLDESLMVGGGFELFTGLNALVGWRALTKNPVLAESSGLNVGDTFDATRGDLPTRDRWETGSIFFGVSVTDDLLKVIRGD